MSGNSPVVLNRKIWIPDENIANHDALRQFRMQLFFDANCEKCPYYEERGPDGNARPTEACLECKNYFGEFNLHEEKESNGTVFHGVPWGDKKALAEIYPLLYDHPNIIDQRPATKFVHPIQFTGTLRDYQQTAVDAVYGKSGILKSKPRTGKTVMATRIACQYGHKTLILGSQIEWLKNFENIMIGSPTEQAMTNIPQLREEAPREFFKNGRPKPRKKTIIGYPKTLADYQELDICLTTYHLLMDIVESGRMRLEAIRDMFPLLIIDEADLANADEFSKVVGQLNCRIKLGITATNWRKDGREVLMEKMLGPVLHVTETQVLQPKVAVVESKYVTHTKNWNGLLAGIEASDVLLEEIVINALADVEYGHSVVIPLYNVDHVMRVYKEINKRAGEKIAAPVLGKLHMSQTIRDDLIAKFQNRYHRVAVGIGHLVKRGVNVMPWSAIYEVIPSSNLPNCEQRMSRILTPGDEVKPTPMIKYFLINNSIHASCVKNEYYGYVIPELKPQLSSEVVGKMVAYFNRNSAGDRSAPIRGRI